LANLAGPGSSAESIHSKKFSRRASGLVVEARFLLQTQRQRRSSEPATRSSLSIGSIAIQCMGSEKPDQQEIDTMIHPMLLVDPLSRLNLQLRFRKSAHPRRRPANHLWKVAAEVSLLEDRCLMSRSVLGAHAHGRHFTSPAGPIKMPDTNVGAAEDVIYQNANIKMIIIYNHSDATVYPMLEGENSATNTPDPSQTPNPIPTYDQSETGIELNNKYMWNQEYRAYVGYTGPDGVNYLGLPAHTSVTAPVPMAIWDSGRLNIVEDTQATQDLLLNSSIPFTYNPTALQYAESIENLQTSHDSVQHAMLLLYHSEVALGITSDAPSQLLEFTIRDPSVPVPNTTESFDYDVSYLDALYLPVALEAVGGTDSSGKETQFGYVGTTLTLDKFENSVKAFAGGKLLKGYLGSGKDWPRYYLSNPTSPTNPSDLVKIPGGDNVFAESTNASSYDVLHSNLTSSQLTKFLPSTGDNYAVDAIANLWFSWAEYYQKNNPGVQPTPVLQMLMDQPNLNTFPIKTDPNKPEDLARAKALSQIVWDVMNDFSTDPNLSPSSPLLPTSQLLQFILGDNVRDLPGQSPQQAQEITDMVSLLMRGIPNNSYNKSLWYPAPGDPKSDGVAKYNLNPFVWFVHDPNNWDGQRIYAYAYSVDDEFGNILVPNTSQLLVTIGGPNGLENTDPYKPA
jgi:hypothetical protein